MKINYENRSKEPLYSVNNSLVGGIHCHSEIEIIICYSGSAVAYINSKSVPFKAGEFVIVFPNQIHSYNYENGSDFRVIIFPPEYLPYIKHYLCSKIFLQNKFGFEESEEVSNVIHNLKKRFINKDMCDMTRLTGYINLLMADIVPGIEAKSIAQSDTELLLKILNYCTENYSEKISLESISQAMFLTPSKISRLLNNQLGISIPKFIAYLRISSACIQLRNSTASVAEVSNNVGIGNIRTFNRLFQEIIGKSPTDYRNSAE